MKQKIIQLIRSLTHHHLSEEMLGHLALIILQELIKVFLKDVPHSRAHLMDGNADNYHELDNLILDDDEYGEDRQYIVECARKLLKYGS